MPLRALSPVPISSLPAASTPLAGTEVVAVVQSGTTSQVAVSDLTAGRSVSASALTASSGNLTFSGTAQRITGDFSNATVASRLLFQTSTVNGATQISTLPNGTGLQSGLFCYDVSDTVNNSWAAIRVISTSDARLQSSITGTGTYLPMTFYTGGSERMRIDTSGNVGIGTASNLSTLTVNGSFAPKAPSTVNAATYSVAATDYSLRFTTTNCTVTLPTASSFPGRILVLNTITANSVTSNASNVIPLGSNTAGTAILAATAGKFAVIQSDGTNWITLLSN